MPHSRWVPLYLLLLVCLIPVQGQPPAGYGWTSLGVFPFRGTDFVIVKAPTQYVLYFTQHSTTSLEQSFNDPIVRAYSPDLKTWTLDARDYCSTSGDICSINKHGRAGALQLPDGRIRMFVVDVTNQNIASAISSDGIVWAREPGYRLVRDPSAMWERGIFALQLVSFVTLPDGTIRMYYQGALDPSNPDTPSWYNARFPLVHTGVILSAISKDGGLSFVREPGVRINQILHGPSLRTQIPPVPGRPTLNEFGVSDLSAVMIKENGRTLFRIFAGSLGDGAVSYVSEDGLSFVLESQLPTVDGDPKAIVLPDGRIWLITNQYADAIDDIVVYGPQSLFVSNGRAILGPGASGDNLPDAAPFRSARFSVTGTAQGPVTFEAAAGNNPNCSNKRVAFHPEYYEFSPKSGTPPLNVTVNFVGPADCAVSQLIVHAKGSSVTGVGSIFCMQQALGRSDASPSCRPTPLLLPMNKLTFGFTTGASASSQTTNILDVGGVGYPFTTSSSVPWATASPASGTAPLPITVKVDPSGLAPGTYTGFVTIAAEGTVERLEVTAVVSSGPVVTLVQNAGSSTPAIAPNSFASIFGSGFTATPTVWSPVTNLPTTLGGVSVKIGGKPAYISYASSTQLNVLVPPDVPSGTVPVEVTTAGTTVSTSATVSPTAPAWFAYTVGDKTWLAALFANTATYVAPAGSLGSIPSRSAAAGDLLQLYANGLGTTTPAPPTGAVFTTPYPIDDLSRIAVTIAGKDVPVLFAGLVAPGLYQLNVRVPPLLGTGDLRVILSVDGQTTQSGVTLNFR